MHKFNFLVLKPRLEAEESMMRRRVMEEAAEWVRVNCDDRGNQSKSNVTARMWIGMKRLNERIDSGSVIVVPTDKSGKFALMPMDVYQKMV